MFCKMSAELKYCSKYLSDGSKRLKEGEDELLTKCKWLKIRASERVLAKCGMQLEGIARQKYYKNGKFVDVTQYAVLRSDLE